MSDQQETASSNRGSIDRPQEQQEEAAAEGLDTMRVHVTNIIDGFFKFTNRSSTNMSSSQHGEMSDSSRSSPNSSQHFRPNNLLMASNANANSSTESLGGLNRRRNTKKVKFKDDSSKNNAAHLLSSSQLNSSSVNPSRPMDGLPSRRLSNDSNRSSNDNLDGSTSSVNSWEIRIEPEGTSSVTEINRRLSPTAAAALRPTMKKLEKEETTESESSSSVALWFEKYMPNVVNRVRYFCGRIVMDDRFQLTMVFLIVANALVMGLGTFDFIDENTQLKNIFQWVDYIFLITFTIELALQFGYWGYQLFYDGWLVFDFVTIASSWVLDGVQVFRSFRIFRAFRLIVRIPILKSLVYAVLHVLPRIGSIMALFSLIIYIFAVMTTTLFKDYYSRGITSVNYFGRLDYSLFTLFQFVTLEGWADIVREIAVEDYYANFIFGTFLTISSFILYSLVVAVICDSFLIVEGQIRDEIKEQARLERARRKALKKNKKKGKRNLFEIDDNDEDDDGDDDDDDDEEEDAQKAENPLRRSSPMSDTSNPLLRPPPPGTPNNMRRGPPSLPVRSGSSSSPGRTSKTATIKACERDRPARSLSPRPARSLSPPPRTPPRGKTEEEGIDEDEFLRDPLKFTETTSPTATTVTTTLATGELERRRRVAKKKKRRPVKQRISRVQMRLDKLTKTQTNILSTLDELCAQLEDET